MTNGVWAEHCALASRRSPYDQGRQIPASGARCSSEIVSSSAPTAVQTLCPRRAIAAQNFALASGSCTASNSRVIVKCMQSPSTDEREFQQAIRGRRRDSPVAVTFNCVGGSLIGSLVHLIVVNHFLPTNTIAVGLIPLFGIACTVKIFKG